MEYGNRLLPALVDELAVSDPFRVFVSIHDRASRGYRDITMKEFASAVDKCSCWLEQHFGRSTNFQTVSYMGPQDLRLIILLYATIKAGYKLFLSLTKLPVEAHLSLLEDLSCEILLTPAERLPVTDHILGRRKMKTLDMPSLEDCLEVNGVTPYPYNKTFAQARDEPFVCLHTSGSTGMPKAVILKHGTVSHQDLFLRLPQLGGSTLNLSCTSGTRMLFGLPLFHSAGICFLGYALYSNTTVVFASSYPVTADEANAIHTSGSEQGSFLGPNVLIDMAQKPEYLDNLRHLSYLTFGGAALPRKIGNQIKSRTHLFVSFGATETGFYPLEATEPDDWEYAAFSPLMGAELRPIGSGLFEFYFVRRSGLRDHQGVFATFPDLDEYASKDLYSKHPQKEGLWLYEGRSDDIVVFAHGQKFNPITVEGSLTAHPAVSAVLMCSNGQKWASLLVEARDPPGSDDERQSLLDMLWPHIERVNVRAPAYAQITRELVLFTSDDRPMIRAGKGSVLRKRTCELYKDDLDHAYACLPAEKPLDLLH